MESDISFEIDKEKNHKEKKGGQKTNLVRNILHKPNKLCRRLYFLVQSSKIHNKPGYPNRPN